MERAPPLRCVHARIENMNPKPPKICPQGEGAVRRGVGEWELRDTVTGFLFKCQKFNNSFNKEHANSAV